MAKRRGQVKAKEQNPKHTCDHGVFCPHHGKEEATMARAEQKLNEALDRARNP